MRKYSVLCITCFILLMVTSAAYAQPGLPGPPSQGTGTPMEELKLWPPSEVSMPLRVCGNEKIEDLDIRELCKTHLIFKLISPSDRPEGMPWAQLQRSDGGVFQSPDIHI